MELLLTILEKYGLSIAVIVGLSWYILFMEKRQREERNEWRTAFQDSISRIEKIMNEVHILTNAMNQVVTQFLKELIVKKEDK